MQNILSIARALLLTFRRSRSAMLFSLLFPVLLFAVIGSFSARGGSPLETGVILSEKGQGAAFAARLQKVPGLTLHLGSADSEARALADQKRVIVFDASHAPDDATLASPSAIPVMVSTAHKGEAMAALVIVRQALADPGIRTMPFDFALHEDGSRQVSYMMFLLPGVIGFAVMQMCVFSVAQGQLFARQSGLLKGLLLTRMTGMDFVLGTALSRLVIALVQAGALLLAAWMLFKVLPQGNPAALLAVLMLGGVMFVGLGFLISNITRMQEAVIPTANAIMLPMYLLGGVFFPITSLPTWLQAPARWLPLSGFVSNLRAVVVGTPLDVGFTINLAILAGWAVLFVLVSSALLRRHAALVD